MHENDDGRCPENSPNEQQRENASGTKTKGRKRRVILYGALAGLGLAIGGFVASIVHSPRLATVFFFGGLVMAAFAVRLDLINNGSKHKKADTVWGSIVILGVCVSALVLWQLREPSPQPKIFPHFKVSLITINPDSEFELTNEIFESIGLIKDPMTIRGCIVIPAKSIEALPSLRFIINNDSDIKSEPVEVVFDFNDAFNFEADSRWMRSRRNLDSPKISTVAYKTDEIYPRLGQTLPDLHLIPSAGISNRIMGIASLQIVPVNRYDQFFAFWLFVPITTNSTHTTIFLATNGDVRVPSAVSDSFK